MWCRETLGPDRGPRPSAGILSEEAIANLISNQLSLGRPHKVAHLWCSLCARDASYATVFKDGSAYCSIECAGAVPGLYLG
jgi:hypothetical protein